MKVKTFLKFWIASLFVIGSVFGVVDMKLKEANAEIESLKKDVEVLSEYTVYLEEKIMVVDSKLPK